MASYAIIIGVNDYTDPVHKGLKTLKGAIRDANDVYDWIIGEGGVLPENAYLITSTQNPLNPIKNDVDVAIGEIMEKVDKNDHLDADRLYFYFAGHGLGVELDLENSGMCMANWSEYMKDSASLSSKDYKQKFLNEGLFKEVVIWMDCCRNTKYYFRPQGGPGITPLGPNFNPKWMLASATEYQNQAFEYDDPAVGDEKRGIFTSVLLKGLEGDASDGEHVTATSLGDYLYYNVPKKAQENGYSQRPDISGNTGKYNQIIFK